MKRTVDPSDNVIDARRWWGKIQQGLLHYGDKGRDLSQATVRRVDEIAERTIESAKELAEKSETVDNLQRSADRYVKHAKGKSRLRTRKHKEAIRKLDEEFEQMKRKGRKTRPGQIPRKDAEPETQPPPETLITDLLQ